MCAVPVHHHVVAAMGLAVVLLIVLPFRGRAHVLSLSTEAAAWGLAMATRPHLVNLARAAFRPA